MKKKVFISAMAVCLAALTAFGSLAYFTDSHTLTNQFMTAEWDPEDPYEEPDEIFSIKVDELDLSDGAEEGDRTEEGNQYERIKPADVLDKDPTICNTGKYPQYIRMSITVTQADEWKAAYAKWLKTAGNPDGIKDSYDIFGGFNSKFILAEDETEYDSAENTLTYVFYLNEILEPGMKETLFETVTIPSCFDNDDMLSLQEFKILVRGEAIQSEHTASNAAASEKGDAPVAFDAKYAFNTYWDVNNSDNNAANGASSK